MAQIPKEPSVAIRSFTGRGQDQTQSGSYSLRQYIETLGYDELETVNHDEEDACARETLYDGILQSSSR